MHFDGCSGWGKMRHQGSYFALYWSHFMSWTFSKSLNHSSSWRSNWLDVTSALDGRRQCLSVSLVSVLWLLWRQLFGRRVNGTAQEEAPRFESAPEVFKVHRLPGHLQSKSVPLASTRCRAVLARKLASYVTPSQQILSHTRSETAMLADDRDFKRLCAVKLALVLHDDQLPTFSLFIWHEVSNLGTVSELFVWRVYFVYLINKNCIYLLAYWLTANIVQSSDVYFKVASVSCSLAVNASFLFLLFFYFLFLWNLSRDL